MTAQNAAGAPPAPATRPDSPEAHTGAQGGGSGDLALCPLGVDGHTWRIRMTDDEVTVDPVEPCPDPTHCHPSWYAISLDVMRLPYVAQEAAAELAEIATLLHMSGDNLAGRVLDVATRLSQTVQEDEA